MNILIVEDNISQAESLALVLKAYGHSPYIAPTALGAYLIAETHKPGAVVLDLILPAGGSITLIDWFRSREETKEIPIVVSTGLSREKWGDIENKQNVAILEKPFTVDQLMTAFESIGKKVK